MRCLTAVNASTTRFSGPRQSKTSLSQVRCLTSARNSSIPLTAGPSLEQLLIGETGCDLLQLVGHYVLANYPAASASRSKLRTASSDL